MPDTVSQSHNIHLKQQAKLNSKPTKRLEYSSVEPKRGSQQFFDNLSKSEQRTLLDRLKLTYSLILFDYFSSEESINSKIDSFVQEAFSVNLPTNQVIKIHIEIIDSLERQLALEGLHTEYLKDLRLTLIDVMAHLGEMYRSAMYCKYKSPLE